MKYHFYSKQITIIANDGSLSPPTYLKKKKREVKFSHKL